MSITILDISQVFKQLVDELGTVIVDKKTC